LPVVEKNKVRNQIDYNHESNFVLKEIVKLYVDQLKSSSGLDLAVRLGVAHVRSISYNNL
jgi:hypothetical protein